MSPKSFMGGHRAHVATSNEIGDAESDCLAAERDLRGESAEARRLIDRARDVFRRDGNADSYVLPDCEQSWRRLREWKAEGLGSVSR